MPSSPESVVDSFTPLQLEQLQGFTVPAEVLPQFCPTSATAPSEPQLFEVAAGHGLDAMLVEQARAAAQAVGYAQGWAEGVREGRAHQAAERRAMAAEHEAMAAERRERTALALSALDRAAGLLENRALRTAQEAENAIIDAAFDIAEAIVGTVLRDDRVRGSLALRRALALAPVGEDVTVALHPADHAVITSDGADTSRAGSTRRIDLVADESLEPGDAVASWQATTADARISSGLRRVREVLGR